MMSVGIIMGSTSDWETMRHAAETLEALGVTHETRVVSAHRTPQRLYDYATTPPIAGSRSSSGCGRCRASAGHGGLDDPSAVLGGAGRIQGAERHG